MLLAWGMNQFPKQSKTKKISKSKISHRRNTNKKANKLQQQRELDEIIAQIQFNNDFNDNQQCDNIDDEILRLEKILNKNQQQSKDLVTNLQIKIREEQKQIEQYENLEKSGENISSIDWLIHMLQQKQIAQSITKVTGCERGYGECKFSIQFQQAMNITPHGVNEQQIRRINHLREISLFKFYKTGIKSIYSYTCHNSSGLVDLHQNRMNLTKYKDKDYLLSMKKGLHLSLEMKKQFQQFGVCHHCKYIYPSYYLITCKFISDRQSMPRTLETDTDLHSDSNLQKGRISQRFVSKHRNCFSGYAKINDQYVCNRKFCKSCLKDCYGSDWMKNNNGQCPFCLGVCSCTRCLRHQKMNKLKSFFVSIGGDLSKLQQQSKMEKLPIQKNDAIYQKPKAKLKRPDKLKKNQKQALNQKNKIITKQKAKKYSNFDKNVQDRRPLKMRNEYEIKAAIDQQTERWSSTAQKQVNGFGRRTSNRKLLTRMY